MGGAAGRQHGTSSRRSSITAATAGGQVAAGSTSPSLLGELAGASSPASTFSPIVGAQLSTRGARRPVCLLPLRPDFEHVIFVAAGGPGLTGCGCGPVSCCTCRPGWHETAVAAPSDSTLILLGGVPLGEPLLMWWNFVARTPEEIAAATAAGALASSALSAATRAIRCPPRRWTPPGCGARRSDGPR